MQRSATLGALAGALLLAAPAAAYASPFSPPGARIYCVPGSTSACFGASFLSSDDYLELWIQNVQGSFSPDPTPFVIEGFNLSRLNQRSAGGQFTDLLDLGVGGVEPVGNVGNPLTYGWSMAASPSVRDETLVYYMDESSGGIGGCTEGAPTDPGSLSQHCPRRGLDGWHRVRFPTAIWFHPDGIAITSIEDPGLMTRTANWDDLRFTLTGDNSESLCTIAGSADGYPAGGGDRMR